MDTKSIFLDFFGGFMKKGLKKFLGVAMVSGISASAIGSNYCGANAISVASVPGMTDEEVAWMNSKAEYWSILQEVWKTEPSQWGDDLAHRLLKSMNYTEFSDIKANWDKNFSKKESWIRAEATKRQLIKEADSNQEKSELLGKWIYKILYGDLHISSAFG